MSWLTEDPTLWLVTGALAIAALTVAFVKTGRVVVIAWALAVVAVVGLGVLVERLIVTEREEVAQTIEDVRHAFLDNDSDEVLTHVSPEAKELRQRATWILQTAEVLEARVTDGPHIEINSYTTPHAAKVELIAVARGHLRSGATVRDQFAARFRLRLIKQNDRWLIEEVSQDVPFGPGSGGR